MSFFPIKFQTEDGYTFYILYDGSVVDSPDPEAVDMSWPNIKAFYRSFRGNPCNAKNNRV